MTLSGRCHAEIYDRCPYNVCRVRRYKKLETIEHFLYDYPDVCRRKLNGVGEGHIEGLRNISGAVFQPIQVNNRVI